MAEKKQELEKRLQDVTGQLGASKKATKKGNIKYWRYILDWKYLSDQPSLHLQMRPHRAKLKLSSQRIPCRQVQVPAIHRLQVRVIAVRVTRATVKQVRTRFVCLFFFFYLILPPFVCISIYTYISYIHINKYICGVYIYIFVWRSIWKK